MHSKVKLYALILAVAFLAGCKDNASADAAKLAELQAQLAAAQQQSATHSTEVTPAVEASSDELPLEDEVPANSGQDDTVAPMGNPSAGAIPKDDSKVAAFWERYSQTNPEGKIFGHYPNFSDVNCSFVEPNGDIECTQRGRQIDYRQLGLPYLLNDDVAVAGEWMQCSEGLCIQGSTGQPLGLLQPKMSDWMIRACKWADISTFTCRV